MSDNIDHAVELNDFMLKAQLTQRRDEPVIIGGKGYCLYCDEPVLGNRRWCDAQCRDDWQKEFNYN